MKVSGMIAMKCATTLSDCAFWAKPLTDLASSWLTSMLKPLPVWKTFATIRPRASAKVETTSK